MDFFATLAGIKTLSVDEGIRLIEAIWDSITSEPGQPELTKTQRAEPDSRLAAHKASPDDAVPWEEVKAQALERRRRSAYGSFCGRKAGRSLKTHSIGTNGKVRDLALIS